MSGTPIAHQRTTFSANKLSDTTSKLPLTPHLLTLLAIIFLAQAVHSPSPVVAQGPQVLQMGNGIQFEGIISQIPQYEESFLSISPYLGKQIVLVDDGLRQVFVSHYNIGNIGVSTRNEIEFDITQRLYTGDTLGQGLLRYASPFDEFGHRVIQVLEKNGGITSQRSYVQGITKINPRWCELETLVGTKPTPRRWDMRVATSSIPKSVIRRLLLNRLGRDNVNVNDYFDVAEFFRQAKDFDQASLEYFALETKFPDQKERIRELRDELKQLSARHVLTEVKTRFEAGQTLIASSLAEVTVANKPGLVFDIRAEYQDIQSKHAAQLQRVQDLRKQVFAMIKDLRDLEPDQLEAVKRFSSEIESDLSIENIARLDAYLQKDDDVTPGSNKIALAISGWLLGSNRATANLATVSSMYTTRDLVMEYLQLETTPERREEILRLMPGETGTAFYIDAMLRQAKPVAAENLENYDASEPIEFFVEIPGTAELDKPWRFRCLAHLPPEYTPYKRYPTIITLPDGGGESVETFLNIWTGSHNAALSSKLGLAVRNGHAMRHGYIVVAVDWRWNNQRNYNYSAREHRTISEAIFHSMRKFSVDPDRVFLAGHGTGADAAYDFGIAHPEHFAGIVGYAGSIKKYAEQYKDAKHVNLPIYAVIGEKDYVQRAAFKRSANRWLRSGSFNELTLVHYKGRPPGEYFLEDIPKAFDWMRGQSRRWPDKRGFEFEVRSLRNTDCYYWFFEMDGIPRQNIIEPPLYDAAKKFKEITFTGKLNQNVISVGPRSNKIRNKTTIWLSPEFIDFKKRVEIRGRGPQKIDIVESKKTLLNDVLRRGDTAHPFWARLDYINGDWEQVDID